MSIEVGLLILLAASIFIFFLLCMLQLGLKFDAGFIFGFSIFFEFIGYTYQLYMPGSPLHLLWALPLLPVIIAVIHKPAHSSQILQDQGIWLWFIFLLYSVISIIWAVNDASGMTKEKIMIIHGVIPGLYTYVIYRKYKIFSWSIVVTFGAMYSLFHLVFGTYSLEYPGRLTMPGGNPIYDARLSLLVVVIALWGKNIPILLRIVALGVAIPSALATQSRGPILALIAANVIVLVVIFIRKRIDGQMIFSKNIKRVMVAIAMISVITTLIYSEQLMKVIGESRFNILIDRHQLTEDANYVGRKQLQEEAFQSFADHPYFGTGLGGNTPPVTYSFPHNVLLEIASELGLFGVMLWLLAFVASIYAAQQSGLLLVLLLQTLFYALMSGDFGFNYEYILVAFTAFALYTNTSANREEVQLDDDNKSSGDREEKAENRISTNFV